MDLFILLSLFWRAALLATPKLGAFATPISHGFMVDEPVATMVYKATNITSWFITPLSLGFVIHTSMVFHGGPKPTNITGGTATVT